MPQCQGRAGQCYHELITWERPAEYPPNAPYMCPFCYYLIHSAPPRIRPGPQGERAAAQGGENRIGELEERVKILEEELGRR